jgi:DnaJ family protein C protein 8
MRREQSSKQNYDKKGKQTVELDIKIDEDDPDKYRNAIYVMTCKLFADIERLKVREAEKAAEEK